MIPAPNPTSTMVHTPPLRFPQHPSQQLSHPLLGFPKLPEVWRATLLSKLCLTLKTKQWEEHPMGTVRITEAKPSGQAERAVQSQAEWCTPVSSATSHREAEAEGF